MRYIDMQTWSRQDHFRLFNTFNHPHFSMCANIDVTAFQPVVKQCGYSLTIAIVYIIARASNAIPEFRYRIRKEQVVEHEIVNPSFTILVNEDLFTFCTIEYTENFSDFATRAEERVTYVKSNPSLNEDPGRDDMLFMTPIPWVSFTSFIHPMNFHPADSIPRFAWGKIFNEGGLLKIPLSVQGHHAVMDGIHMGRFYKKVEEFLLHPKVILESM